MKLVLRLLLLAAAAAAGTRAADPTLFATLQATADAAYEGVDVDGDGFVYAASHTSGQISGHTSAGNRDIYFTIHNAAGVEQCNHHIGGSQAELSMFVLADGEGGAWVGVYVRSLDLEWGSFTFKDGHSFTDVDGGLAHFDSACTPDFALPMPYQASTHGGEHDLPYDAKYDADRAILAVGTNNNDDATSLYHGVLARFTSSSGAAADYTLDKSVLYAPKDGATDVDIRFVGVASDPATRDVYVVGTAEGGSIAPNTHQGDADFLIVKFDSDLNVLWSRTGGSSGEEYLRRVAVTPYGVLAGGYHKGDAATPPWTSGGNDGLVVHCSKDGVVGNVDGIHSDTTDQVYDVRYYDGKAYAFAMTRGTQDGQAGPSLTRAVMVRVYDPATAAAIVADTKFYYGSTDVNGHELMPLSVSATPAGRIMVAGRVYNLKDVVGSDFDGTTRVEGVLFEVDPAPGVFPAPSPALSSPTLGGAAVTQAASVAVDVAFDARHAVAGLAPADLVVTGPAAVDAASFAPDYAAAGPGSAFSVSLTVTGDGAVSVSLPAAAGYDFFTRIPSAAAPASLDFFADSTAPSVAVTTPPPLVTKADNGPADLVLTFSDNHEMDRDSYEAAGALVVDDARAEVVFKERDGDAVTYSVRATGGTWAEADFGTYTVSLVANKIFDKAGHPVPPLALPSFDVRVDETPPTVLETTPAPAVSTAGAGPVNFVLEYDDNFLIDDRAGAGFADAGDLVVDDPRAVVEFVEAAGGVATYRLRAVDGTWNEADTGTYTVSVAENSIFDAYGPNPLPVRSFTPLVVSIDETPPGVVETTALPATITVANSGAVDLVLTFSDNGLMNRDSYEVAGALVADDARVEVVFKERADDVVTYSVRAAASGHKWSETETDVTPYTVSIAENKIFDAAGHPVPATSFTPFTVTIDETAPAYVADNEPRVASSTADSVTVRARANEDGALRCCAWPASAATRDADAIRGGEDGAQGCSTQAVTAGSDADVELEGLTVSAGATFFDVWCLLEDDAPPAALANEAEPFEIANVLVGACPAGVAPQFDVAGSEITAGGDLLLKWSASAAYETYKFAFVGAEGDPDCSMQALQAGAAAIAQDEWESVAVDGACNDDWTFTRALPETLAACGFSTVDTDPAFTEYRATVEVTTVEDTGAEVFGQAVKQTRTTATEFGVLVPKSAQVTSDDVQAFPGFAGLEADGRSFAVVSTQAYNVDTETFTLRVITAVAWPYVLDLAATPVVRTSGSNEWTLGASFKGGDCDSGAAVDNVCVQQWDLTLAHVADCEVDGEYDLNFDVRCSNAFGNGDGCETHENPTASVTVPLQSDSVCARVVEVGTVTPTLVTSTTQGGAQATDFVLQTTLYGRVSVAAEGGIATSSVVLTDLLIDSDCTSCVGGSDERRPLSDSSPDPADDYSWDTTSGTTFADFEFQLNADSVPFDTGAGQASITMTATVAVTYVTADLQEVTETRRVQMQAGGDETASARATANFGVGSSAPSGGASSSAPVVTGTVAVAAFVGLIAVVAVAAVTVVRARRRRRSAARREKVRSSSTIDVTTAGARFAVPRSSSMDGVADTLTAAVSDTSLASIQMEYDRIESGTA